MSSRIPVTSGDEIMRYLEGLREHKRAHEDVLAGLQSDRQMNLEQLDRIKLRLESLEDNIANETEKINRVQEAIDRAETTYAKLKESSQSLVDFLKKEYQEMKESSSSPRSRNGRVSSRQYL